MWLAAGFKRSKKGECGDGDGFLNKESSGWQEKWKKTINSLPVGYLTAKPFGLF
jgi:hypothetical protein